MKKLNMFQKFDFNAFITGKEFCITSIKWNEHKNCVSTDVTITADSTDYGDPNVTNLYQSFKVHLLNDNKETDMAKYKIGDAIQFVSVGKATVWGDYSSNLSVCAEIKVLGGGK